MSVYNYIQGVEDNTNARYNFLIQGGSTYTSSLGLMLKDDVTSASTNKKGSRISHDNSNNAFFDLRTTKANNQTISMRMIDDSNPTAAPVSMLTVTDDDKTNASRYGATVTGRVKASQYFVGEADTRTPSTAGVYLGMDASTTGYFKVNKGASGTGGFKFTTYNADGSLAQTNLELNADGTVKATKYSATNDALDTESRAFATVDANGQLVRDFGQNARLRSIEDRVVSLEEDTGSVVPAKVNEIITRMNSLYFFSSNIDSLAIASAPTPYNPYGPTSAPTTPAPTTPAPTTPAPTTPAPTTPAPTTPAPTTPAPTTPAPTTPAPTTPAPTTPPAIIYTPQNLYDLALSGSGYTLPTLSNDNNLYIPISWKLASFAICKFNITIPKLSSGYNKISVTARSATGAGLDGFLSSIKFQADRTSVGLGAIDVSPYTTYISQTFTTYTYDITSVTATPESGNTPFLLLVNVKEPSASDYEAVEISEVKFYSS